MGGCVEWRYESPTGDVPWQKFTGAIPPGLKGKPSLVIHWNSGMGPTTIYYRWRLDGGGPVC